LIDTEALIPGICCQQPRRGVRRSRRSSLEEDRRTGDRDRRGGEHREQQTDSTQTAR
jgi:hypothetical protein